MTVGSGIEHREADAGDAAEQQDEAPIDAQEFQREVLPRGA